ncbi:MAG TPA: hypothetical protein VIC04_01015 [Terriglobia bacterium]|jgi:hypothetical protein
MREDPISSELYEEIISGRGSRERKLAVCSGSASLIAAERAELLAVLAEDADELVRDRAGNTLLSQPLAAFVAALAGDSPAAPLFRYCGRHLIEKPEVALALAKHWRCPPQLLPAAARRLTTSAVQELLNDLGRLSALPALVSALQHSASLTADQQEQLRELLREDTEPESAFASAAADAEPDREKRATLLQRLAGMRVVERVQMALKGNREERLALIRDPCKVVQRAVLQSPRLSDREVEAFSAMANLSDEVLRLISRNRTFVRNPIVIRNLMNNPKTPLDITLHWLPNLTAPELKALTLNRNIPDTLRSAALRLQRQRSLERTGV